MRQEIQYALTLTRWLALEGRRCISVEEFWTQLVFAAQRLGYSLVRLSLADGQRTWRQANGCEPIRSVVCTLQGGRLGTLELEAPRCGLSTGQSQQPQACGRSLCPCVADDGVFEIVSELLAEAWVRGVSRPRPKDRSQIRFDTCLAASRIPRQRQAARSVAAAPLPEPGCQPTIARQDTP